MEKQKIMFFIYRMGGGGAARTMLNLINFLDRSKFEPILVTLDFTYDYEKYIEDDVAFIKLPTKRLRSSIIPLAKLIRRERPAILFSTVSTYNVIAILAKLLSISNTKVIVREAAYLGGSKKENVKLKVIGTLYRFSKKVISLSNGVKENLMRRYGVNGGKIAVIYNPVDLAFIDEQMEQPMHVQIPSGHKIIVSAGRLVKEKDQMTLLRAFAKVHEKIASDLILLGEGELKSQLEEEADQLQIQDHVRFVGFQENPYAFFRQADVFVLTSTTEGFGHVIVEALATGTPVVSTRCKPGGEEVLAHGAYGDLVEVGNVDELAASILKTLELSDHARASRIAKGRERAEQFAAEKIVKQYEAVFMEVINR